MSEASSLSLPKDTGLTSERPRAARMDLSILIVNWKSVKYLRPCLSTIFQHVQGIRFEVILVDNASFDGSAELVRNEFPQVKFVQSEKNLGFARANNLAFRHSSGDAVLLLNPDTELLDDAVTTMSTYLQSARQVGAVGCCLLNSDRSLQTECIQAFPTIWNQLLDADVLQRRFPRWKIWGMRPLFDYCGQPLDVEILAGSCIMLKRSVFEEVGLFSDEYYMYGEDVDLCYKIRRAGYAIHYIGAKKIIHHGGITTAFREESQFSTVMQKESILKFFRKTRGWLYAGLYRGAMAGIAVFRLLLLLFLLPFSQILVDRKGLAAARRKWSKVLRWAFGLERWAETAGT